MFSALCIYRYRKIPGDECEGGTQPERKVVDLSKTCVSSLISTEMSEDYPFTAAVIAATVAVLLVCIVGGVFIIKKYVCGGRSVSLIVPYGTAGVTGLFLNVSCQRVYFS